MFSTNQSIFRKRTLRPAALSVLGCLALIQAAAAQQPKPKLVLAITVDQFRYDYLSRFRSDYNGGLARLLERGAVFTDAHYEHAITVTAIGHSTILSGATPSLSGILGNEWYDRATGKEITSVSDSKVQLLGGSAKSGASPHRLLVSTVGDELKIAGGGKPRVIGISSKDRSAILPAGRMADAAYWFDADTGTFVSSTYYFADLPGWVKDFNASRPAEKYLGAEWKPFDAKPGAGVKPFRKMPAAAGPKLYSAIDKSPFGNELIEQFAMRAIESEGLGSGDRTDVLAISFSANDRVGHDVGPDHPEVRDITVQTDRVLGRLFDFLDRKIGMDKVTVVLTADHGVAPVPEVSAERKMPGGRLSAAEILERMRASLNGKFGEGNWFLGKAGPTVFLNHALMEEKKLDPAEVERVAADAARKYPNVWRVYTRDQVINGGMPEDRVSARVRNAFFPPRSFDLLIIQEPYWLFQKTGTTHGTPFAYDSHVPVVFMGQGIIPGKYTKKAAVNDIAPTLAALLDVAIPSGSVGRVLEEMLEPARAAASPAGWNSSGAARSDR